MAALQKLYQEYPFKYILCYGSSGNGQALETVRIFKYILCYGSSAASAAGWQQAADLNTSYVMVHLEHETKDKELSLFKYILCYGSSWKLTPDKVTVSSI